LTGERRPATQLGPTKEIFTMPGMSRGHGAARQWSEEDSESLDIINESDISLAARSFLSQLTTPRATPLLSPDSLSPRSSAAPPSVPRSSWGSDWGSGWCSSSTPGPAALRQPGSQAGREPRYLSYCLGLDRLGLGEGDEVVEAWDSSSDSSEEGLGSPRARSAPPPRARPRRWVGARPRTAGTPHTGARGQ
jgi:hypothetical protein